MASPQINVLNSVVKQSVVFCLSDTSQFSEHYLQNPEPHTDAHISMQPSKHAVFSKISSSKKLYFTVATEAYIVAINADDTLIEASGNVSIYICWHWPVVMAWLDEMQACVTVCAGTVSGSPTLSVTCHDNKQSVYLENIIETSFMENMFSHSLLCLKNKIINIYFKNILYWKIQV